MKLGFITACLPKRTLPQLCECAAAEGYEALEVAAWPNLGDRPFTATSGPSPRTSGSGVSPPAGRGRPGSHGGRHATPP